MTDPTAPVTLRDALHQAQSSGLPRLDAQWLLLWALGRPESDRAWLLAHDDELLQASVLRRWQQLLARRLAGEPHAYLRGEQGFGGLVLQVDPRVLIPRPDTETLVEWALECLTHVPNPRVLDLGTGSGAIALTLGVRRPDAILTATDRSAAALAVTATNAQRLNVRCRLLQGDWLQPLDEERFDLIVSNPPYIAENDPHLTALTHEPQEALTSGPDGLRDLRHLIENTGSHLVPGAWLLLEHGHEQSTTVCQHLKDHGFEAIGSRTDLAGIARCSGGRWPRAR